MMPSYIIYLQFWAIRPNDGFWLISAMDNTLMSWYMGPYDNHSAYDW